MNKLPTKQIYLLFIIIVGIIALSVYSTYALFTYENETSDIVSIHIPKSLTISENIYEYQQLTISPSTVATTDIDIYNAYEYEVCYSIWYKIIGEDDVKNNIQIFELTKDTLTSSGTLSADKHIRVTLVIINDNENDIKINIGTIGAEKKDGSCSLNISSDKSTVSTSYKNLDILSKKIIESTKDQDIKENYLVYKEETTPLTYGQNDEVYVSNDFEYKQEIFTLKDSEHLTIDELIEQNRIQLSENNIYICHDKENCNIMYRVEIKNIEIETIEATTYEPEKKIYHINKYDKYIGYSSGKVGLRKINSNDYIYYGDHPNNYIYYNCENNDDLNTCELWRIVGFFYNPTTKEHNTKIVSNNSIGKYQFDYKMDNGKNISSNKWIDSNLSKYLNDEYELKGNNKNYLDEYKYHSEKIKNLETDIKNIQIENEDVDTKINILTLSDYLHASSCEKDKINEYKDECFTNNWLNNIEIKNEWSMTSKEVEKPLENIEQDTPEENNPEEILEESTDTVDENNYVINYVYTIGSNILEQDVNGEFDVRPSVFLKPRIILLDGNGSFETPYVVK